MLEESLRNAIFAAARGEGSAGSVITVLTTRMPFIDLVKKFGAICLELDPALGTKEDIKEFCGSLLQVNEDRNWLIHSAWYDPGPADQMQRYKPTADQKHGLKLNLQDASIADIDGLILRIKGAEAKIWEIVIRGKAGEPDAPPTSP